MNDRVVWTGDVNPLTKDVLKDVGSVWIAGSYTAHAENGKCYIAWGQKPVLSFSTQETADGKWEMIMRQNPKMGTFPDKVMDNYEKLLAPVVEHITRATPDTRIEI